MFFTYFNVNEASKPILCYLIKGVSNINKYKID